MNTEKEPKNLDKLEKNLEKLNNRVFLSGFRNYRERFNYIHGALMGISIEHNVELEICDQTFTFIAKT